MIPPLPLVTTPLQISSCIFYSKTSVCKEILRKLGHVHDEKSTSKNQDIIILCQSDFYKVDENLSNKEVDEELELNYDHPGLCQVSGLCKHSSTITMNVDVFQGDNNYYY
jgi:uridine kinase